MRWFLPEPEKAHDNEDLTAVYLEVNLFQPHGTVSANISSLCSLFVTRFITDIGFGPNILVTTLISINGEYALTLLGAHCPTRIFP